MDNKKLFTAIIVIVLLVVGGYYILQQVKKVKSFQEAPVEAPVSVQSGEAGEIKIFNLTGKNFAFSQIEIRVKKGDRVRIEFESAQGFHDWSIDEFDARTKRVNAGGKTSVEFVVDKVGTFEYYCSVGSHRQLGMIGNLIVEASDG